MEQTGRISSADVFGEVSYFFLKNETVLVGLELVVDHFVDLLLEEVALFFEEKGLFVELRPESVLGHFEVVFDHQKRVLEPIFQYSEFLLHHDQGLFGLRVGSPGLHDAFLQICLRYDIPTIRFFIGSSLIMQL